MDYQKNYTAINAKVWDAWSAEEFEWTMPISHQDFAQALNGSWAIKLTPVRTVPKEWFPPLKGCRVLGLAAGGGQQMPVLAAQGALCTLTGC
ncbi:MAG: hypothetical protein A2004_01050 [Spirochaetes bacterium GWC1_61_12]|nr:MAG: hypothetical protein A2Y37_12650 [Spirochaetes bacterium GWB1_60_80]OHD32941.1 MAG: hypothetical protein A2004_01050 [Spirochaetes bacterium GWC1_61_12]HAP42696.1 hypothetical protein [Spirochaetaceae bacterium]OHD18990.1 MAG: hypothetical protein A2Y37_12655 [Spirochaetes bacterium GWB1_60_80]HBO40294.1 hypothetical protein [Spirochaetaceae bacterium]